jgi:hypothetical protein
MTFGVLGPVVGEAQAQTFDVPEGFVSEIVREPFDDGSAGAVLRVHPETGSFSALSSIEMRPIVDGIDDPNGWLQARMTASFEALSPEPDGMLDSPDSPLSDPEFDELRDSLSALIQRFQELGNLPLEYCEPPVGKANGIGDFREMSCDFALGPLSQYVVLRLQQVDGVWYYTRIRTMNERRLRHLVAIANSFHVD